MSHRSPPSKGQPRLRRAQDASLRNVAGEPSTGGSLETVRGGAHDVTAHAPKLVPHRTARASDYFGQTAVANIERRGTAQQPDEPVGGAGLGRLAEDWSPRARRLITRPLALRSHRGFRVEVSSRGSPRLPHTNIGHRALAAAARPAPTALTARGLGAGTETPARSEPASPRGGSSNSTATTAGTTETITA